MVYVPRDDHGRLLRVEYQPFVGITDNQYTDLPEAARNKLDEQALALALALAEIEGLNSLLENSNI
ncbi:TPA: hypothetical protein SL229_006503 [Pseudomonas aeruginosa]|nr:hypothetical protein [Pseudomonas aeruginosa]